MLWPPDYKAEFSRRLKGYNKITADLQKLWPPLYHHYSQNPVDWINDWCITYDPRAKKPIPKVMPFILFPRQVELVQFLHESLIDGESGLIEKARDMGASWVACAFSVWMMLFIPGAAVGFGSRKEDLVDKIGDPKSLIEKIRMTLRYLPPWMMPEGFDWKKHASHMKIINPENRSNITGEAGDNIGRGGRTSLYFKDEAAHYERPELIEAAIGDNTDVQIDISSVNGPNNVFYRRRMAGEVWEPGKKIAPGVTRVFIMDWRDHPGKTQAWYDKRRKKADEEGLLHVFAQEVDRDYTGAQDRIIIQQQWVKAAIDAHIKLSFSAEGAKIAGLDVADEGGDKNAYVSRHGVVMTACEDWGEGDTGKTARRAVTLAKQDGVLELFYDSIGVGAGVKAETNRLKEEGLIPKHLSIKPWSASEKPLDGSKRLIQGDFNTPTNEDFFLNLKAQGWWRLSQRFYKTFQAVTQGAKYDPAELISLPSTMPKLNELTVQLSQATQVETPSGKMKVDKKADGARSPNLADAVVMCYCPMRKGLDYNKLNTR